MVFGPADQEDQERTNDPDVCGYYLMPYDLLDTLSVRFGGMFATQLDIEWSESSYAAAPRPVKSTVKGQGKAGGAGETAEQDWSMVERDTRTQRVTNFRGGPFPDIQRPVD